MKNTIGRIGCLVLLGVTISMFQACQSDNAGENTQLGMASVEQLKYEEALTYFEAAQAAEENDVYVQRGMGLAYMGMTEYEQALVCFQTALNQGGNKPSDIDYDMNYYMAVCYYKLGSYEEALSRYDAIIALRPKEVDAYYQRGLVKLEQGAYQDAVVDFDQAISLDTKDYGLYIDIYSALKDHGYEQDGLVYLNKAMESEDKSISAYDQGRLCFYLGNYTDARNYLENARSKGNRGEDVFLLLGQSYEALNDSAYALTLYEEYVKENPSAAIYNQMGLCYARSNDYENALASFEKGLNVEGNAYRQELSYNQIVAYENLGNFDAAKKLMQTYLEQYPDDERAQREYEFLQTR